MLDKTTTTPSVKAKVIPVKSVIIKAPNFETARVRIRGTAPMVQNRMSQRAREAMEQAQIEGTMARRKTRKREPKDFQAVYEGAMHISTEGWYGIPCSAFRAAMISACRTVDFAMTRAKLSLFIVADGYDKEDRQPLTRLYGEPHMFKMAVRLASGTADIAARPMWEEWHADLTIRYDADAFSATDVINLLARSGIHCGIGAGRPDSKESAGMGFGTFCVEE
jgi:hypothetical protein